MSKENGKWVESTKEGLLERAHECSNGESGTVYQATSVKVLNDEIGKEQALSYANRGWLIAQQNSIRTAGQETLTAKRKAAIAKLRDNPEIAKELGIDLDTL